MDWITAIALDIAAIAIICLCAYKAAKKGFLRTVVQMIAYVVILAASAFLSRAAAPILYERMVEPMLFQSGQEEEQPAMHNADLVSVLPEGVLSANGARRSLAAASRVPGEPGEEESLSLDDLEALGIDLENLSLEDLKNLGADLEGLSLDGLKELGFDPDELNLDRIKELGIDPERLGLNDLKHLAEELPDEVRELLPEGVSPEGIARELAENTLRPVLVSALGTVSFVLLFAALSLIANLLLSALGIINHLPVVGFFNATLGAAVGILQGVLIVWVVALLFQAMFHFFPDGWWIFHSEAIDRSFLFKYFVEPGLLLHLS